LNDTETLSPVLPDALEEATRRLLAKACERELVLTTAESCTGGMLAVTGFADARDEPGPVHFACARRGRITAHREEHFGPVGRGRTRVAALEVAVEMMTEML
jgi:nicotinamide mononucleotide (NMN) deamidase PncC